jgi:hypothetical protein
MNHSNYSMSIYYYHCIIDHCDYHVDYVKLHNHYTDHTCSPFNLAAFITNPFSFN